jgi:hypothetical protein
MSTDKLTLQELQKEILTYQGLAVEHPENQTVIESLDLPPTVKLTGAPKDPHPTNVATVQFGVQPTPLQQTPKRRYDKVKLVELSAAFLAADVTKNGINHSKSAQVSQCERAIDLAKTLLEELEL